jgi:hypothetical protein
MPFALTLGALVFGQTIAAVHYWFGGDEPLRASVKLRVASVLVGIGLIALASVAWDGLGIAVKECSSLTQPSDVRSSEEAVLISSLVAAGLSLVLAAVAGRSRRAVGCLVAAAVAAMVVAALYFLDHAYRLSCFDD